MHVLLSEYEPVQSAVHNLSSLNCHKAPEAHMVTLDTALAHTHLAYGVSH